MHCKGLKKSLKRRRLKLNRITCLYVDLAFKDEYIMLTFVR